MGVGACATSTKVNRQEFPALLFTRFDRRLAEISFLLHLHHKKKDFQSSEPKTSMTIKFSPYLFRVHSRGAAGYSSLKSHI